MILFALLREEKPNNRWRKYSCRDSTKWGECLTPKMGKRRAQTLCTDHKKSSPPPPPLPSSSSLDLDNLHKEKPNKPWCKYSCRECGEDFTKWGKCLAHLKQSGHMGMPKSKRRVQTLCMNHKKSSPPSTSSSKSLSNTVPCQREQKHQSIKQQAKKQQTKKQQNKKQQTIKQETKKQETKKRHVGGRTFTWGWWETVKLGDVPQVIKKKGKRRGCSVCGHIFSTANLFEQHRVHHRCATMTLVTLKGKGRLQPPVVFRVP